MKTIDGKYYVLDDAELRSAHKVRREKDSKNVLRCQCPLCSANRKKEHRKEKCVAVYPDDGWAFCYNCGNWFWTEAWYDAHVAPKRNGHKAKEQKSIDLSLLRTDFPQAVVDYFEKERRLPMELVRRMGIRWIPRTVDGSEEIFIAYPTFDGARCVNVHYRPLHKEKGFSQEAGCDPIP